MKKISKKSSISKTSDGSFSRTQVLIGIVITIITCLVVSGLTIKQVLSYQSTHRVEINTEGPPITVEGTSERSILALKAETDNNIKTPDSEVKNIEVQNGDNFWKISKRACGKGNYYLQIQADSGYSNRALKAGDIITVDCSKY